MNYEKKFKEALERAKDNYNAADSANINVNSFKNTLIALFPELAESEDEKIRKWIVNEIKIKHHNLDEENVDFVDKAIAWLEKQETSYIKRDVDDAYLKGVGDAKNEIEKQYEANYQTRKDIATFIFNYKGDIKDRAKWMDYLGIKVSFVKKQGEKEKDILEDAILDGNEDGLIAETIRYKSEKQFEQKPTQSPKAMTKLEEKLSSLVVAAVHTYCEKNLLDTPHFVGLILGDKMAKEWSKGILTLAEEELRKMRQKPAEWSEEDEKMLDSICISINEESIAEALRSRGVLHSIEDLTTILSNQINWLKSIKDRVQPQPKQEWSEEDKNFMYDTLSNLTELKDRYGEGYGNVGRCIDWLKSLRHQNRWKPSDEQMEILLQAVAYFGVSWANKDYLALQSLYFDLKKLKENKV